MTISWYFLKQQPFRTRLTSWSGFNELTNVPWDRAFVSNDMNEVWNACVDQCIPKKNKTKNQRTPWILEDIVKRACKKKRSYKKARSSDNADLWSKYKNINNMLKKKCSKAWWEYLKDLASKVHNKKEHTLFWTYFNSKRKGCNDLIKLDQVSILTDECLSLIHIWRCRRS